MVSAVSMPGLRFPFATCDAYGCDNPTSWSWAVSDLGFSMRRLLHFATVIATPNNCSFGKASPGRLRQIVAMAKKSKKRPKGHPGHYLLQWREFRGMTQEQLAAKVKPATNASVISLLESGGRGLSNKWLGRLAPALGTKKGFILDMNPYEADTSILEIWGLIPEDEQPRLRNILEQFTRKVG